jgi:hypothetical protein
MVVSNNAYEYILSHTKDPLQALRAADKLPDSRLECIIPRVAFPPAWVLRQQQRSAVRASFAVRYCDDKVTQETIWNTTRRKIVKLRLAQSSYIDPELRLTWEQEFDSGTTKIEKQIRAALGSVARRDRPEIAYDVAIKDLLSDKPTYRAAGSVWEALANPRLVPAKTAELISGAAKLHQCAFAIEALHLVIGASSTPSPDNATALSNPGLSLEELLTLVTTYSLDSKDARSIALRLHALSEPRHLSAHDATTLITHLHSDVRALQEKIKPGRLSDPQPFFNEQGVDVLLEHPDWVLIAATCTLTNHQFVKLLDNLDLTKKTHLLAACRQSTSPERLRAIFTRIPEGTCSEDPYAGQWLRHSRDADDDLIVAVVNLTKGHESYILGGVAAGGINRWPSSAYLATTLPKLVTHTNNLAYALCSRFTGDDDLLDGVLLLAPGIIPALLETENSRVLRRIDAVLDPFTEDLSVVLDLLSVEGATLDQVRGVLPALRRSASRAAL